MLKYLFQFILRLKKIKGTGFDDRKLPSLLFAFKQISFWQPSPFEDATKNINPLKHLLIIDLGSTLAPLQIQNTLFFEIFLCPQFMALQHENFLKSGGEMPFVVYRTIIDNCVPIFPSIFRHAKFSLF